MRKSTDHGLEQQFNSLDNQEQSALHILNQQFRFSFTRHSDAGGGTMARPALKEMLGDIQVVKLGWFIKLTDYHAVFMTLKP